MKIAYKLGLGFGILLLAIVTIIFYSLNGLKSIDGEVNLLVEDRIPKVKWSNNVIDAINSQVRSIRDLIMYDDIDKINDQINDIKHCIKQ